MRQSVCANRFVTFFTGSLPSPIMIRHMTRRRAQSTIRILLSVCIAGVVLVAATGLVLHFIRPVMVVTEAVEGPVVQAFYSTGTIQPEREFPIKSNTAGILTEVKVDKGDHVKKDQ